MNAPSCPDTGTALQAGLGRLRRRAPRSALFMVILCTSIAVILAAFERGSLVTHLIYSFTIGAFCWALTECCRLGAAALTDRLRQMRGLPPDPSGFGTGWRGVVPAVLLSVLIGPPLGMSVADRITGFESPSLLRLDSTNTRVTLAMTLIASLASFYVLSSMERLSAARAQAEAAQRQAAENQLRLLQSQLEPHMLFNTLANLRVLIGLDPPRAQEMLDHMIAFLRSTLGASRADAHALSAEFDHLADYLALMAVRMGPRLQVGFQLPTALAALPVPPLLLQPLVENAIKHGLEPQVDGGRIEVAAQREGRRLTLTVRDSGGGLDDTAGTAGGGFGLTQVRERLKTLYGETAGLQLTQAAGGGTLATLWLPIQDTSA
jgi:sensor histidine kinase YesM